MTTEATTELTPEQIWDELDKEKSTPVEDVHAEPKAQPKQEEPAAKPEAAPEAAPAQPAADDPYAGLPEVVKNTIVGLQTQVGSLQQRVRQAEGRVGELNGTVKQWTTAPRGPSPAETAADRSAWLDNAVRHVAEAIAFGFDDAPARAAVADERTHHLDEGVARELRIGEGAAVRARTHVHLRPVVRLREGYSTDGGELVRLRGLVSSYLDAGAHGLVLGFLNGLGEVDAGVIIHESQLTYREEGLHKVVDFGELWKERDGLPVPLTLRHFGSTEAGGFGEAVK